MSNKSGEQENTVSELKRKISSMEAERENLMKVRATWASAMRCEARVAIECARSS